MVLYTYDPIADPWTLANEVGVNSEVDFVNDALECVVDLEPGEDGTVGKASARREDVPGALGNKLTVTGTFTVFGAANLSNLAILDFEDQTHPLGTDPGVRCIFRTGNFLCLEGKLTQGGDYRQGAVAAVLEQPFALKWEVWLHPQRGRMRLTLDGTVVIDVVGVPTMEALRSNKIETGVTAWLAQDAVAVRAADFLVTCDEWLRPTLAKRRLRRTRRLRRLRGGVTL